MFTDSSTELQPLVLPELPYAYNALEPCIAEEIMRLHHTKHHQAYVNNFNAALEKFKKAESEQNVAEVLFLQKALNFNGGGHLNHSLFWTSLLPPQDFRPLQEGALFKKIEETWGSFENFEQEWVKSGLGIQGSGWSWLSYCPQSKHLSLQTTSNQDPLSNLGYIPLCGIDVWEHAYYLQYKNDRGSYIKALLKCLNWSEIEKRFNKAVG